jgi:MoxR-like ATPase
MTHPTETEAAEFRALFQRLETEIQKRIVGQDDIVQGVLVALFAGGHVLLEGVPGLGKTMLVRTLADVTGLQFSRVQFTPDLMPADIAGTNLIAGGDKRGFEFQKGPVFANLVLADEINRATPKTQSALLEAMQEHHVTVGGTAHPLPKPFLVLATQNPLEMEGTYPLPEAQLDRFLFKLKITFPTADDLHTILDRTTADPAAPFAPIIQDAETLLRWRTFIRQVPIAREVQDRAVSLVLATHPDNAAASEKARRFVRYGASPRGAQALILAGKIYALLDHRFHVAKADIDRAALAALRHRIILNFEGEAKGCTTDEIVREITA